MQTQDDFLGGRVRLWQEKEGLRATSDSVLVAAAVRAESGNSVLDVGTGNGVVALCLNARVSDLKLTGLDVQPDLVALAEKNAKANGCDFHGIMADLNKKTSPLHGKQFHHVVTNPPFYDEPNRRSNDQVAKAYHQGTDLAIWLNFCLRHVRAKGTLTLIHRPEELPEILQILDGKLGGIEIIPVQSKAGEPAKRVLVRGRMNSKKKLTMLPALVMHTLGGKRTRTAERILRHGVGI